MRGLKEFNLMDTWETTPDNTLPLISREEWGAKKPTKPMKKVTGYYLKYAMIIEGGERCFTQRECISRMRAEQEEQMALYGDLVDNFYIGDDGYVYEGRGFIVKPLWDIDLAMENNKYFKDEFFTVRFFGNFQTDPPSEKAIGAFKLLVKAGISINKIPDSYGLYSLRGIYNSSHFLGDGFYQIARKWTPWANDLDDRFANIPKDGEGFIGMIKRTDWEGKDPTKDYGKMIHPVDHVIINERSGSVRCLSSDECVSLMKEIQEEDQAYGDVTENFYISDIGNVYEGRGWDTQPQFQPRFFNKSLITVNFLGSHQEDKASLTALAAFDNLIRVGVKLGKIAPNYKFYSYRNVYDEVGLLGDGLKKYFDKTEKWDKILDDNSENERLDLGILPVIPYKEWSDESMNATFHPYSDPVRYVVIGNLGERCFTHEECTTTMKETLSENSSVKGLSDNFYIGDNGNAYEGRGWNFAPGLYFEGLKSEFYHITFLGNYEESQPSKFSTFTFNRLMEYGVRAHKLSPDFKVVSIHQIFESSNAAVDNLYKSIKTWNFWTSEFSFYPAVEETPSGNSVFVPRADWHAEKPLHTIPKAEHPISCVVVHNVGEHCSDLTSCTRSLQTIQKNTPAKYWDVADNFYVGDDGHVYEGRGWDHSSLWATKGIETKILSVGFLGSFESPPPSPKALLAFHILLQTGMRTGKLTTSFKTVSLGRILKSPYAVSEKVIGALMETDSWSDDFELKYDRARLRSLLSPFVLSDEWNSANLPMKRSTQLVMPIKYVTIRDGGESCSTNETCAMRIKNEHEGRHDSSDNGVGENFYVGDDGNVYEGIGWDWDMTWGFNGWQKAVSVQFFGSYESGLPSAKAIEAFNAVIINDGLETGKLSPNYKIVPIPDGDGRSLGSKLREEIMTWKNAAEEIPNN